MAEIPVEKKERGVPWWVWLAAVLVLVTVAAFVARGRNQPATHTTDNTMPAPVTPPPGTALIPTAAVLDGGGALVAPTVVPTARPVSDGGVTQMATGDGGLVSDINIFATTADKATLLTRRVEFSNVRVTRVISDRVFTVTSGTGELFALLDDALNNGPMEQRVTIQAGQLLDVQGSFRRPPNPETVDEQNRPVRLPPGAAEALHDQVVYLHVTLVRGSAVH